MEAKDEKQLRGYELKQRIGDGGFGEVYLAHQTTVGREVAIKIIHPRYANHPEFIRRFEAEAHLIARLEHPHITPLHDFWRDPQGAYLVMRYLKGGSVYDALKQDGAYELEATSRLLDQIASALDFAHRNEVIHRDIKPANLLIDEDGNVYLADFGIAKDLGKLDNQTANDAVVGSLDYISPEQARSEPVTPRTDIYSLGVTLYEVVTGQHPFGKCSSVEKLYKHISEPLPLIDSLPPDVCDAVNEVIQAATAKNPEKRYPDVVALALAFREAIGRTNTPRELNIVEHLTLREQEILALIADGFSNQEIAAKLVVTVTTVKYHITHLYKKLGVRSRVQAIVRARELDLIVSGKTSDALSGHPSSSSILLPEPENPYRGLHAFQTSDSRDFFGREELTDKLISRMNEQHPLYRFLAIIGPSGSGKSSLVKAGLIPGLWRGTLPGSERWFVVDMLPGTHPLDSLETALIRVAANHASNLQEQLQRDDRGLLRVADIILPGDDTQLLIVVDQFEEVFTLVEDEQVRQHFLELLRVAVSDVRSRVRVVITLRADYYDRPLHYPEFGEMLRSRMETVLPLSAKGLELAIRCPAERAGVIFEAGLIAQIVSDMNYQSGALPLLQYALTELFDRREGRVLTHAAYQQIGSAVGALANRADEIYQSLTEDAQQLAQQMFLRLVTLGEGAEDTRRRTTHVELLSLTDNTDLMEEIIDQFAVYRLLSLDHDAETRQPTVEVAHEAILREWARLRQWLNDCRDDIRQERAVSRATEEWQQHQRDVSFLLRGSRLEQVQKWRESTKLVQTPLEQEYIAQSLAQREKEAEAERARQQQVVTLEKRSRNFLRGLVAVFAVSTVIALVLSLVAFERDRQSQRSAAEFRSIALTFGAQDALENYQPDTALALSAEAINFGDSPLQAITTFNQVSQSNWMQQRFVGGHSSNIVWDATFLHDGEHIITTGWSDNIINKWHIESGEIVQSIQIEQSAGAIVLHPEMELIAIASVPNDPASGIVIWNLESDTQFTLGLELSANFLEPEFSPDGTRLVSTSDGTAYIWDVATWEIIDSILIFEDEHEVIQHISLSNDGKLLTAACRCPAVKIVNIESGDVLHTRSYPDANFAWTSDFLLDSNYVLIGRIGSTSYIELWNWQAEEQVWEFGLTEHPTLQWVRYLEVSPDGKWFTLAMDANSLPYALQLHDAQTGRLLHEYYGHTSRVMHVHYSPNGQFLVTTSRDGTAAIWNTFWEGTASIIDLPESSGDSLSVHPTEPLFTYPANGSLYIVNYETGETLQSWIFNSEFPDAAPMDPTFSPDGQLLVAGEWIQAKPVEEQNAYIWNVESGDLLFTFNEHDGWIRDIDFSPTEPIVAISQGLNNHILLWQYETGELLQRLEGLHSDHPGAIAFSPDGNYLFSGDQDGVLVQWDITTGEIVRHFIGHTADITSLDVNSSGTRLLSSGESTYLWDINTGEIVTTLIGNEIFSSQFSPDSTRIVTLSRQSSLQLWDADTGHLLRQYSTPNGLAPYGIAYTSDGENFLLMTNNYLMVLDAADNDAPHTAWIAENRYIPGFTCEQRALYIIEPLCDFHQ